MFKGLKVTLVLPCRNEEGGLKAMLSRVPAEVDEVVVVDNCSTDGTAAVAEAAGARVVKESAPGYGNAYKTVFSAASGDVIVTMDADDTSPLDAIASLLETLTSRDLDFITVRRMHLNWERTASLVIRFIGKKFLDLAGSALLMRVINDSQSGMWVFRRSILDSMRLTSAGMSFSEEIKMEAFVRLRGRAAEIPVVYQYRRRLGGSKLNLIGDGFYNLYFLFVKRALLIFHDRKN